MVTVNAAHSNYLYPKQEDPIVFSQPLRERFLTEIRRRLPIKSFGYLISEGDPRKPTDFLIFDTNIRNSPEWKGRFESYGQYFLDHEDAGFVATPEESWQMHKRIRALGMVAIGVFHSHLRHPANFSSIDYDMHTKAFDDLWHMIISVRNPDNVQIRAFSTNQTSVRELPVTITRNATVNPGSRVVSPSRAMSTLRARQVLSLKDDGRPLHNNSKMVFDAITCLQRTGTREEVEEILVNGFLAGDEIRYQSFLSSTMQEIHGGQFQMGSTDSKSAHFVGESPAHTVKLSPFEMGMFPVTNQMFGLFDERWLAVPARERQKPAVNVTWYDAAVFAMWMGCRLPTEAEWEFACGNGSSDEWSSGDEDRLYRYAWYSKNSNGQAHEVGKLKQNELGLFDMHGNVWEWCGDGYDQDHYANSSMIDPFGLESASTKACRGGSFHALSEMCRTRYRFHDPPGFSAMDLGFRLAKTIIPNPEVMPSSI